MADETTQYDVVVLGGGTGGYVAAIRGAQLGLKVAVVEKDKVGGTCLHRGCIPSKALLRSAELMATFKKAEEFGLKVGDVELNFGQVQSRKRRIVGQLYKGVQGLLKKNGVTVYEGVGRLMAPSIFAPTGGVSVTKADGTSEVLAPKNVILATGSRPKEIPGLKIDGERILDSDRALDMEALPGSIIIIGAGAIGVEWASLLTDFGVKVTLVEMLPHILPLEDDEVAEELTKIFTRRRLKVMAGTKVLIDSVRFEGAGVQLDVEKDGQRETLEAEKVMVAIGRAAVTEDMGFDNFNIKLERGVIQVDEQMRTSEKNIYAIGDVNGGLQLAHVAAHEGIMAMENIAGENPPALDYTKVPRGTYCRPEVASVGLTEKQAVEKGYQVQVGKFPFRANGKALIYGEPDGFVKVIGDEASGDLLGVHMVGPHVTDLIDEAALAQFLNATTWELGVSVHPHPTLTEVIGEAALAALGRAIHI
ncbi:MAG: dihydrolipoyl dehydrogenase [Symbiobacteriia bacterium]